MTIVRWYYWYDTWQRQSISLHQHRIRLMQLKSIEFSQNTAFAWIWQSIRQFSIDVIALLWKWLFWKYSKSIHLWWFCVCVCKRVQFFIIVRYIVHRLLINLNVSDSMNERLEWPFLCVCVKFSKIGIGWETIEIPSEKKSDVNQMKKPLDYLDIEDIVYAYDSTRSLWDTLLKYVLLKFEGFILNNDSAESHLVTVSIEILLRFYTYQIMKWPFHSYSEYQCLLSHNDVKFVLNGKTFGLQFSSHFIQHGKRYDRFCNSDREHVESHVRFMARGSIF